MAFGELALGAAVSTMMFALLVWLLSGAAALWTFVVMLGHTTTQGGALPSSAYLLAIVPDTVALLAAAALIGAVQRARGWTALPFWMALPPAIVLAYLTVGLAIAMWQGR
jgi:hypothetical protein